MVQNDRSFVKINCIYIRASIVEYAFKNEPPPTPLNYVNSQLMSDGLQKNKTLWMVTDNIA